MIINYFGKDLDIGNALAVTSCFTSKKKDCTFWVLTETGNYTFDFTDSILKVSFSASGEKDKLIDTKTTADYTADEILTWMNNIRDSITC